MKGSCLCGEVAYEIGDRITGINYCHCTQCRKASGSAFGTSAGVPRQNFTLSRGHQYLSAYQSTPDKKRFFCRNCGSPIYSDRQGSDTVYIRLGTLDDEPGRAVDVHIHVASKASWYEIRDDIPQLEHEEGLWF